MSELKAINAHGVHKDDGAYYDRIQADEYIAELEAVHTTEITALEVSHKLQLDGLRYDKDAEIRRLKRALWIARANSARNKVRFFGWAFDCYDIYTLINIDGHKYKMPRQNRLLVCHHWIEIFENVEQLCKAKADEYK